jgi:hypothetical protein
MVADDTLMEILQQNHENRMAEIVAFGEGTLIKYGKDIDNQILMEITAICRDSRQGGLKM